MPVKATVNNGNNTYVSVDLPGHGKTDNDYNVAKSIAEFTFDKFPAFQGTEEEWAEVLRTATKVEITNLNPK